MSNDTVGMVKSRGSSAMWIGVAHILFGMLAIATPFVAGISVAIVVGILVVAAGAIQAYAAFQEKEWGRGLVAALYVIGGIFLVMRPMFTLSTLTLLVAIWFAAMGAWRLMAAASVKEGRGWLIFGAILSIVLAVMIIAKWPLSSTWAIGTLVGIEILFSGIMLMTVGSTMRGIAKDAEEAREA